MKIFKFVLLFFLISFSGRVLSEERISQEEVLKNISEVFAIPKGWVYDRFTSTQGKSIRYGYAKAPGKSMATVVFVHGYEGSVELSFNLVRGFLDMGIDVWYMDWYGQGDSGRAPGYLYTPGSQPYYMQVDDLYKFATEVVERDKNKPFFVESVSMGGNIVLRFLNKYPDVFDFASVASPMVNINTLRFGLPFGVAYLTSFLATLTGRGDGPIKNESFAQILKAYLRIEDGITTHSLSNTVDLALVLAAYPDIRVTIPSFRWMLYAFSSIYVMRQEGFFERITTPVFLATGTDDIVVDPMPQIRICRLMPNCEQYLAQGAYHYIWGEAPKYFDPWYKARTNFIRDQINRFHADHRSNLPRN